MNKINEILTRCPLGSLNALELSRVLEDSVKTRLTSDEQTELKNAMGFAMILHSQQTRKNRNSYIKTPYIEHPLRNTIRLVRWGIYDNNVLIASLLHDVVEDSSEVYCSQFLNKDINDEALARQTLLMAIEDDFNPIVKSIVVDVTNELSLSNIHDKTIKNTQYRKHVAVAIHNNPMTFLVKLSDFIDNATGLMHNLDNLFIQKNSHKYQPLIEVFNDELTNLISKKMLNLDINATQDIRFKLMYTQKEYDKINA